MRVLGCLAIALSLGAGAAFGLERESSAASLAGQCTTAGVRAAIGRFIVAYNGGDAPRLDALFASEPEFQWYSAGPPGARFQSAAYRRDTLLSYFRDRHRHGDRLRLLSFDFHGNSNGFGHFEYKFERRARDYRAGKPFKLIGKGAAVCDKSYVRFAVMSLGGPEPG